MRFLRYLFLALLAICLLIVALANREPVTLNLLPDELATFAGANASSRCRCSS
jgi:lipopolysaccharide assembly protein A